MWNLCGNTVWDLCGNTVWDLCGNTVWDLCGNTVWDLCEICVRMTGKIENDWKFLQKLLNFL